MWPPSQAFQFRVIVATTMIASRTTRMGAPYFRHAGFSGGAATCSGSAAAVAADGVTGVRATAVALSVDVIATPRMDCDSPVRHEIQTNRWLELGRGSIHRAFRGVHPVKIVKCVT